jgi:hypothetical protein
VEKITVPELLKRHNVTWYQLYRRRRGSISKSMAFDWARGAHLPNRRSALKIAQTLGLPPAHVLATLRTREKQDNRPPQPVYCLTCHRRLWRVPNGEGFALPQVA